jgi:hypothetical protein
MVTNVPGDNVFPGDDGFRASPHKEYVPSMFYVENKELKYIVYICNDKSSRYKDHFIEAYVQDTNENMIGSNFRLVKKEFIRPKEN